MSGDWREVLASRITEAGGQLKVKSALNPALWLCAIISAPAVLVGGLSENPPWWIPWLAMGPVALAGAGFVFLLLYDRDKLQSEDFQLRKRTLEMFEQKGMDAPRLMNESLRVIAPSELPQSLPRGDEK